MPPDRGTTPTPAAPVPTRLPPALVGEFLPAPQLLAGRLAASTVTMYTWDCAAYVTFGGYDSAVVLRAETLRRWRTHLVADTTLSPHTINRMLAAVKRVVKEGAVQGLLARSRRDHRERSRCGRPAAPARFCGQAAATKPAVGRALSRPRQRRAQRGEP